MRRNPSDQKQETFSFGLYFLVALVAFSPCLFLGQAYFDNDLLAQFGPWRAFLKDQLVSGHFPLWNPYSLGGQPFFADLQNMMLYPVNYLTLPFSVPYGLSVFFFLHMVLAAVGMHLWLKALGLSTVPRRMGALLFALSNFFWLEIIHPPVLAAFAWLPWLFWALEKLAREPKPRRAFGAGLVFAMLFVCGSFQMTVGAFYGGLAYFLFRAFSGRKLWIKTDKKQLLFCASFLVWGALPLLGQLIPTAEFSARCNRLAAPMPYDQAIKGLSLAPLNLHQLVFPRFTLKPGQEMSDAIQFNPNAETSESPFVGALGYLGAWVPLLAFWAFRRKDRDLPWFLLFFALVVLAVCLGRFLPLHRLFWEVLPAFSIIHVPFRFIFLYVLGLSALAALGLEGWLQAEPRRGKDWFKEALVYGFGVGLIALLHPLQDCWEILALVLGLSGLTLASLTPSRKGQGVLLLQAALVLPLLVNGWDDFLASPSSNFDYAGNSGPITQIGEKIKPFRLMFDNSHMSYPIQVKGEKYILNYPQNAACALGIKNMGGYNPLILQVKKDLAPLALQPSVQVNATKGILTQKDQGDIPGFAKESYPPYLLYVYQGPLSYVYAPTEVKVIPDPAKLVETLSQPGFDLSQTILFSEDPRVNNLRPEGRAEDKLKYELKRDEPDAQDFSVTMPRDGWVVFPEVNYPGWKVQVDGAPWPLLTADHVLRTLYLPVGTHEVDFGFEPGWLWPITGGLLLWLVTTWFWFSSDPVQRKLKNFLLAEIEKAKNS